jgi:hypothetical protein
MVQYRRRLPGASTRRRRSHSIEQYAPKRELLALTAHFGKPLAVRINRRAGALVGRRAAGIIQSEVIHDAGQGRTAGDKRWVYLDVGKF